MIRDYEGGGSYPGYGEIDIRNHTPRAREESAMYNRIAMLERRLDALTERLSNKS